MDEVIQRAIKQNEAMRKTSVPWQPDEPYHQPYFAFDSVKDEWTSQEPSAKALPSDSGVKVTALALHSWNIDFMLPLPEARMAAALRHLRDLTERLPASTAVVIYLQECVRSDLSTIGSQPWIRDKFYLTDTDTSNWASGHYGTTTLVDRRLPITSCFRVHYSKTRMERDAFFVDVLMQPPPLPPSSEPGAHQPRTVRLANTHLESLALEPPFRPPQMELCAKFMRESGVHAALAAGDFNAIQDFDRSLHSDNGLRDAYLELGGRENVDEGYTWGQQAATVQRERFGCSRMDKVFFRGGIVLKRFERFGADVILEEPKQQQQLVALGFEKAWITDHLGVMAEIQVVS